MGHGVLAGRTAIVTGASRGIGRAVALELGAMGARVVITARSDAALAETVELLRARKVDALALAGDLREPAFLERLAHSVPAVDVLLHNAAAFAPYAPLERVDDAEFERVLDVNLRAPLQLTSALIAGMKQRGFGRIVALGTIAASHGADGQVAYSTAKAGLTGFIKSLAAESADHGVTANVVEPGLISTERIAENVEPIYQRRILANTAIARAGTPEEVAALVAFLCTPSAAYITGAVLPVSGGFGVGLYARETTP